MVVSIDCHPCRIKDEQRRRDRQLDADRATIVVRVVAIVPAGGPSARGPLFGRGGAGKKLYGLWNAGCVPGGSRSPLRPSSACWTRTATRRSLRAACWRCRGRPRFIGWSDLHGFATLQFQVYFDLVFAPTVQGRGELGQRRKTSAATDLSSSGRSGTGGFLSADQTNLPRRMSLITWPLPILRQPDQAARPQQRGCR